MSKIARKPAPGLGFEPDSIVHRQGMALFHFVKSEAIEVMRAVGAQPCEQLRREFHAIRLQLLQRPRDGVAIVKDHQVGDQVVVFDNLELIVANVPGDGVGTKVGPLGVASENGKNRTTRAFPEVKQHFPPDDLHAGVAVLPGTNG